MKKKITNFETFIAIVKKMKRKVFLISQFRKYLDEKKKKNLEHGFAVKESFPRSQNMTSKCIDQICI